MTNRQWLLEQMRNMSDEELAKKIPIEFKDLGCWTLKCEHINCLNCRVNWLKSEHKEPIKLSDAERIILENISEHYKYITRDANGNLFIYQVPPVKIDKRWFCNLTSVHISSFVMFNDLFQFIKWEDTQAYNIQELLEVKDGV
ncbi:MAG: hypothetical protein IJ272_02940 [Clostridia bacterium]|nr:hypothetical protein [Clostridia bacterium]